MNAIVMNLTTSDGKSTPVTDPTTGLTMTVSYGGQSKALTLQPLGEDTPGQYDAPMLPAVAGLYTVDVTGKLGTTAVKVEVQPEEVQSPDSVQFPIVSAASTGNSFGLTGWLALAGLVIALAALVLAMLGLRKSHLPSPGFRHENYPASPASGYRGFLHGDGRPGFYACAPVAFEPGAQ